ncbi:MAG: hypothetical protein D3915_01060 [Candidatus Electrothrix sp. AU1_5]|nr:hypothetical protein [Candidatus Electrothrix gigas]
MPISFCTLFVSCHLLWNPDQSASPDDEPQPTLLNFSDLLLYIFLYVAPLIIQLKMTPACNSSFVY